MLPKLIWEHSRHACTFEQIVDYIGEVLFNVFLNVLELLS
jgi:hypothetical protein